MTNQSDQPRRPRPGRKLNVGRIKLVIVSLAAAFAAVLACITGITSQGTLAPMITWMLGFSPGKSQATTMRATAGIAIGCIAGALWRSSVSVVVAPAVNSRLPQIHVAGIVPGDFGAAVLALFTGATVGSLLAARLTPKSNQLSLRRVLQFVGVCIGIYVAAEGAHYTSLSSGGNPLVHGTAAYLVLGIVTGALTKVLGLASGVLFVPSLYYLARLTAQQSVLLSLAVIGLAAVLPAWSYLRRGLGDQDYAMAAMIGGILCAFVGGAVVVMIPSRIILLCFALLAMFLSAREISIIALERPQDTPVHGPDLTP